MVTHCTCIQLHLAHVTVGQIQGKGRDSVAYEQITNQCACKQNAVISEAYFLHPVQECQDCQKRMYFICN